MAKKISIRKSIKAAFLCVALGGGIGAAHYSDTNVSNAQKPQITAEQNARRQGNQNLSFAFLIAGIAGFAGTHVTAKRFKEFSNRLQHLS